MRIRRDPVYVLTSIMLISASIGLACTAFAVFDALILRKLPVPIPDQLVLVSNSTKTGRTPLTRTMFEALRRDRQGITQIFGFLGGAFTGSIDGNMGTFAVDEVVGDFFSAQGAVPEIGRFFAPDERAMVGVITDKLWRTRFGADPAILSRSITIGQSRIPIIGVTSPQFRGTEPYVDFDAFFPLGAVPDLLGSSRGAAMPLEVVARLQPEVTVETYASHLNAIWPEIQASAVSTGQRSGRPQVDSFNRGLSYLLQRRPNIRRAVTMTLVLAALIFAAACLTLALLAIARAAKQQRQVAIMLAIGGSRWQILRPYFAETIVIAALGCAGGLVITLWWNHVATAFLPASSTIDWGVELDARSAGIAIVMSALAAIIGISFTAWLVRRTALTDVLHLANPLSRPSLRLRICVLTAQLSISVLLLHYGLAYVGDLRNLANVTVGFDARELHVYSLSGRVQTKSVDMGYFQQLSSQVRELPGVEAAALTSSAVPLSAAFLEDRSQPIETEDGQSSRASTVCVFPGYFEALKLPLLAGRDFTWNDGPAAVLTEAAAGSLYAGTGAVGHSIKRAKGGPLEIVGIVGNIAFNGQRLGASPVIFIPCREQAQLWSTAYTVTVFVRSKRRLDDVGKDVRNIVDAAGVHWVYNSSDQETIIAESQQQERMLATVSGVFGGLIVLLTAVGLYAFCNYVFAMRTRELAIRAGLGARPSAVAASLLRETIVVLSAGSVVGIAATFVSHRALGSLLLNAGDVTARQVSTVMMVITATTLASVLIPVTRAIRMDIAKALRAE